MDGHVPDQTAYQHSLLFQLSQPKNALIIAPFAAIGALFVSLKLLSFVRLVFSLFVLPGKSVCLYPTTAAAVYTDVLFSSALSVPKAAGPLSPAPQTASASSSLRSLPAPSSISYLCHARNPSWTRLPSRSKARTMLRRRPLQSTLRMPQTQTTSDLLVQCQH